MFNPNLLEIDLELHKLIEQARSSFDQTQKAIIVDALWHRIGLPAPTPTPRPILRSPRSSRVYKFTLIDQQHNEGSLKAVLKKVMLELQKQYPNFLSDLSTHRTPKGRRIVARTPEEIYPRKPHLVKDGLAEELCPGWWYDTNISANTTKRYLNIICDKADLLFGMDLKLEF